MCNTCVRLLKFSFVLCSHAYITTEDKDDGNDNVDANERDQLIYHCHGREDASMKKPVMLDKNGSPYGKMTT